MDTNSEARVPSRLSEQAIVEPFKQNRNGIV